MAEELQSLIDRIHKDSIEKGDKEAADIIKKANEKAAATIAAAEEKAKQFEAKAKAAAESFEQSSRKTLEQAARDVLITVSKGVESLFEKLVLDSVQAAYTPDTIEKLLQQLVDSKSVDAEGLVVGVSDADQAALAAFIRGKFSEKTTSGVEIKTDNEIIKGFTVSSKGTDVYTDFTDKAIAEVLMKFLRPQLAELVQEAVAESAADVTSAPEVEPVAQPESQPES